MTTPIGTAVLQIIPSLDGVSKEVDRQLGGTLKASGRKGGKELAKGVGEGLKDLEREVDSAGKAYQKLKDRADDALGKIRSDEAALNKLRESGASDDRIIKAEERLATSRRNSNRASREAADGHRALEAAQRRLGDGSDDLGGRFSRLSGFADTAGTALAGAGALAGGAALAGIAALGAGAVVAGRQLYDLGAQFDDLSDSLQVSTGLSGAALDQLKGSVETLGTTNVPSTFADIGDVAAEVTRNLHLTGQPLEDITSRLANLDRMGQSVNVRALGKAFRGFGVDVEAQVPSLNALYEASTQSGLSIDDIVGSVVKGGPALRQLGLSFGESAALAAQLEDAGLDVDKMLSGGLTKSLAALAKDGQTGQDALTGTIGEVQRLIQVGDIAGAQNLTNKLFGAKGGLQFFEAIQSGALDLQSLSNSLNQTGLDINDVSDDTADWSERWQLLKNETAEALEPLAGRVFDGINTELGNLADMVSENKDSIVDAFVAIADGTITFAEVGLKSIGMFAEGFGQLIAPIGDVMGAVNDFQAWQADIRGDTETAAALREQAQEFYGLGEGLTAFGRSVKDYDLEGLRNSIHNVGEEAKGTATEIGGIGSSASGLAGVRIDIPIRADTSGATLDVDNWASAIAGRGPIRIPTATVPGQPGAPTSANPFAGPYPRAAGGAIAGPGGPTSDSILLWGSNGEHMFDAQDVKLMGGQSGVYAFRSALKAGTLRGYADGGAIGPDVQAAMDLAGTPYSQANRNDCSGMAARVIARTMGLPESGLMSTKNAEQWLSALGFQRGLGGPGQISVGWYDRGPNPNDGHMAMTLSDGTNAEAGGKNGVFTVGAGAAGADSPQFDQHMFLPTIYGEGQAGSAAPSFSGGGGGSSGGGTPGIGPNGEQGTWSTPDAKSLREADQKVADADARVRQAELKQKELEADAKESQRQAAQDDVDKARREAADARADAAETRKGTFTPGTPASSSSGGGSLGGLSLSSSFSGFGSAIGEFAGGQIGSALDFFGVGDSPPFLQAASQLLGGISIGGGSSAAPSVPNFGGTPPPETAHGTQAGQAPGPVFNTTIQARDAEGALDKWKRWQNQRVAAKVDRY